MTFEPRKRDLLLIGPNPKAPKRKGGVATHIKYLLTSSLDKYWSLIPFYTDFFILENIKLPRILNRIVSVFILGVKILLSRKLTRPIAHVNSSLAVQAIWRDLVIICSLKIKGIPTLLQYHGGRVNDLLQKKWLSKIWNQFVLQNCDLIACFPGPQYREFIEIIDDGQLVSVVNTIPINEYGLSDVLDDKLPRFLFLGSVVETKGIFEIIEAYSTLKQQYPKIRLTIVGEGPALSTCKLLSEHADMDIECTGHLKGSFKLEKIKSANIFLLPSYAEGFPYSALECAASGLAPIATRNSALSVVFSEQKEMLFVNPESVSGLMKAMRTLIENPSLRKEIGMQARKKVQKQFSMQVGVSQFDRLYKFLAS